MTYIIHETTTNAIIRYINHENECRRFRPFFILTKQNETQLNGKTNRRKHTLQYCFVAATSYEPRQSSGLWYQSVRRPVWSRWLKYSLATRNIAGYIDQNMKNFFSEFTICCCFAKAANKTFSSIYELHERAHVCFTALAPYWTNITKISQWWFQLNRILVTI